jgi:hypothetical protein
VAKARIRVRIKALRTAKTVRMARSLNRARMVNHGVAAMASKTKTELMESVARMVTPLQMNHLNKPIQP